MSEQTDVRKEQDSMGEMPVPAHALWGASTARAKENFPVSGRGVPAPVIHAFGHLKSACAAVNRELGLLEKALAEPIIEAADEVARGELDAHFVVDVFQTGSGTSSNMNANEVIANRANQILGQPIGTRHPVHPNDHVNMGQSSNDTFPTALHVAEAVQIETVLRPALERLAERLEALAEEFDEVVKVGRTHLMDATPIRMGQVFGGYAAQVRLGLARAAAARDALLELAIGGTAVGTGINTRPEFGARVAAALAQRTGLTFREAANHPEAQAAKDADVEASGQLRTLAVSFSRIAGDIRWLGSGPRCGLGELKLPAIQPGSSIMPGKVNPVICESVIQVAARVAGNDVTVGYGGFGGVGSILELNVAMPLIADANLESIRLLTAAARIMVEKLLDGIEVDAERCRELNERSLMTVTRLAPVIGYDQAAAIAKQAMQEDRNIREVVAESGLVEEARLNELLDPRAMTEPGA